MSLYRSGLAAQAVHQPVQITRSQSPVSTGFPTIGAKGWLALLGLGAIGLVALNRAKTPRSRGPDVSDIEAKYRARGIDPRTVF